MPAPTLRKKCFVIMPFGDKKNADGKLIDFNKIYTYLIEKAVESLKNPRIDCVRCDEIAEAGWIHSKMFGHIYEADVAIVDITSLNPNVFYELGVRHALAESVTVLIRRKNTKIPFNIQGFQVIEYDHEDLQSVEEVKQKIATFIQNGLKSKKNDSPVHEVLDLKIGSDPKELSERETIRYNLLSPGNKQVCITTGNIRDIEGIDVWVNSENNNLQMVRYFDRSISSIIRYYGAKKNKEPDC